MADNKDTQSEPPVNAWSRKPNLRPDTKSTAFVQPVVTSTTSSGGSNNVGGGGNQVKRTNSSNSTNQKRNSRHSAPHNNNNNNNINKTKVKFGGNNIKRYNIYVDVFTITSPTINTEEEEVVETQMVGAIPHKQLQFGTIPKDGNIAYKPNVQFDTIQRVRSAPPDVIENPQQQQQHTQPQKMTLIPQIPPNMNPGAQTFNPMTMGYPPAVPMFYTQPPQYYPQYIPQQPPTSIQTSVQEKKVDFKLPERKKVPIKIVDPNTNKELDVKTLVAKDSTEDEVKEKSVEKSLEEKKAVEKSLEEKKAVEEEKVEEKSIDEKKLEEKSIDVKKVEEKVEGEKIMYSVEYLLKFKELFTEKMEGMPIMEAIVGESSQHHQQQRRSSKKFDGGSRMSDGRNKRYNDHPKQRSMRQSDRGGGGRRSSARMSSNKQPQSQEYLFAQLSKSENRWRSSKEKKKTINKGQGEGEDEEDQEDQLEILQAKVLSWLNRLTLERFDEIAKEILQIPMKDLEEVNCVVGTILDKAVEETKFSGIYALLCAQMTNHLPDFPQEYKEEIEMPEFKEKKEAFRRILLNSCQRGFEAKAEWTSQEDQEQVDLQQMSEQELETYTEAQAKRKNLKRRTLGNIRFIGELFKLGMLNENIMHACIKHLLRNTESVPEEEEMESVCDLMNTVGKKLDSVHQKEAMDSYFIQLEALSKSNKLQSRIRFKIKDVVELRERQWVERERQQRMNMGPMKISELKKVMDKQQEQEQQRVRQAHKEMRSSKKSEGWNQQKSSAGGVGGKKKILKKHNITDSNKKKQSVEDKQHTPLSTTTTINSNNNNTSTDKRVNIFDALIDQSDGEEEVEDEEEFKEPEKNNAEAKALNDFIDKQMSKDFCVKSLQSTDDAFQSFISVRAYVPEGQESEVTLRALEKLLVDVAAQAFKMLSDAQSAIQVNAFGDLCSRVFKYDLVPTDQLMEMFERQLIEMPDMSIDIPGLDGVLGTCMAHLFQMGIVDYLFLADAITRFCEDFGDFSPGRSNASPHAYTQFYGYFLHALTQEDVLNFIQQQHPTVTQLSDVSVEMLTKPWWGTDDQKLSSHVSNDSIIKWLKSFELSTSFPSIN